jgi:hypothetical protein
MQCTAYCKLPKKQEGLGTTTLELEEKQEKGEG